MDGSIQLRGTQTGNKHQNSHHDSVFMPEASCCRLSHLDGGCQDERDRVLAAQISQEAHFILRH